MEKQIEYVQLSADNAENCKVFESLMYEYIDEMNEHSERPLTKEFQQKWINIASCGPDTMEKYKIVEDTYNFKLRISAAK